MPGEKFNGSAETAQEQRELLQDYERMQKDGAKILDIIDQINTHQAMLESIERRNYAGDSEKSRQAMAKDQAAADKERDAINQLIKEANDLGGAEQLAAANVTAPAAATPKIEAAPAPVVEEMPKPAPEAPAEKAPKPAAETSSPAAEVVSVAVETVEPISEQDEISKNVERDQAVDADKAEALKDAREEGYRLAQEEMKTILNGRSIEETLDTFDQEIAHLEGEIEILESRNSRYVDEAKADLASMQRRRQMVANLLGDGEAVAMAAETAGAEAGGVAGEALDVPVEAFGTFADEAAGGALDDNNPEGAAEAEARDALAAQRIIDYAEARYLAEPEDGRKGDDLALKGVFLKERADLMKDGMSKEEAEAQIMATRGLDAAEIARLTNGIDSEQDEARYIDQSDRLLAALRKMTQEMYNADDGQADIGGRVVGDIAQIETRLGMAKERLQQLLDVRATAADKGAYDQEIAQVQREIADLERKHQLRLNGLNAVNSATVGIRDREMASGDDELDAAAREASGESRSARARESSAEREAMKKSIFERIKDRVGFKHVSLRAKAAALSVVLASGIGGIALGTYLGNLLANKNAADLGEGNGIGITERVGDPDETYNAAMKAVELAATPMDTEDSEAYRRVDALNDLAGYETQANGVFYCYDEFNGFGDLSNKIHPDSFTTPHFEEWDSKDPEIAANLIYAKAHEEPEALADYVENFPSILEECGLPANTTSLELDELLSNGEEGGQLQQKLLEAFRKMLESEDCKINFDYLNGLMRTGYIVLDKTNVDNPTDHILQYRGAMRNNEKVFVLEYTSVNLDGVEETHRAYITPVDMQTNKPGKAQRQNTGGTPEDVTTPDGNPEDNPSNQPKDDTDTETDTGTDTDTDTDTDTEPGTEEEKPGTKPKTESKPDSQPDSNPDSNPDSEGKNPDVIKGNANIDGTGNVTQTEVNEDDAESEPADSGSAENQTKKEENQVSDVTASKQEQQQAQSEQEQSNVEANQTDAVASEQGGAVVDNDFEDLMDFFNQTTGQSESPSETVSEASGEAAENGESNS